MLFDRLDNLWILAVVLTSLAAFAVLMWLMLRSGKGHPPAEIEADASDYGNVIRSGHAPLTLFLYIFISGVIIFIIVYYVLHWSEFGAILRGTVY